MTRAFESDRRVLAVVQEAEGLAKAGKRAAAADLLEARGRSAVADARRDAEQLSPKSEWGKARRVELLSLASHRDRDLTSYRDALRKDDDALMLEALTGEIETDKKAEALEQSLKNAP